MRRRSVAVCVCVPCSAKMGFERVDARDACDGASRFELGRMRLIAIRDIRRDEFVARSYLDAGLLMSPLGQRRSALLSDWGFACGCARCARESKACSRRS